MQTDSQQPYAPPGSAPTGGSALAGLLITAQQRDIIIKIETCCEAVDSDQLDTLAHWWCDLNARGWPADCEIAIPSGLEKWATEYFMREIERRVPKNRRLAAWFKRGAKAPNNQAQALRLPPKP